MCLSLVLRDMPLVTIDPPDARDHDDAVFAHADDDPKNEGGHVVWVAIADVAEKQFDQHTEKIRAAYVARRDAMLAALGGTVGHDRIAGFIYIGEKIKPPMERTRPDPAKIISRL